MFLNFLKAEFPQPEENPGLAHHVERIWSLYITGILKKKKKNTGAKKNSKQNFFVFPNQTKKMKLYMPIKANG